MQCPPLRSTLFPYTTLFRSSLYPVNSVPQVVKRINGALQRADQVEYSEGNVTNDYFAPIVADRKSTRLNSSHVAISYAVFCLKKKIKDLIICKQEARDNT